MSKIALEEGDVILCDSLLAEGKFGTIDVVRENLLLRARGYFGKKNYKMAKVLHPEEVGRDAAGETDCYDQRAVLDENIQRQIALKGLFEYRRLTSKTWHKVFMNGRQCLGAIRSTLWDNVFESMDTAGRPLSAMPHDMLLNALAPPEARRENDRTEPKNYEALKKMFPKGFFDRDPSKTIDISRYLVAPELQGEVNAERRHYVARHLIIASMEEALFYGMKWASICSAPAVLQTAFGNPEKGGCSAIYGEPETLGDEYCQFGLIDLTEENIQKVRKDFGVGPMICFDTTDWNEVLILARKKGKLKLFPKHINPQKFDDMFYPYEDGSKKPAVISAGLKIERPDNNDQDGRLAEYYNEVQRMMETEDLLRSLEGADTPLVDQLREEVEAARESLQISHLDS